jgi:hypothetical protein
MRHFMAIYLNDHLAGSTTLVARLRYAVKQHEGTELGAFLKGLIRDIEEDRQALRRVMAAAGVRPDPVKQALARAAEKAGRLKLNGRLLRRSPLAPLLEIEAAELGITGKLLLWRVLRARRPPGADAVDLDALIARAERQRDAVEEHRIAAAAVLHDG